MTSAFAVRVLIGIMVAFCLSQNVNAQYRFDPDSRNLVFAYCFDDNRQIVPNCDVTLFNGVYATPYQHNHYNNPAPPRSQLLPSFGNTGPTGMLPVIIRTTEVGQRERLTVCAVLCTHTNYLVGYWFFLPLWGNTNWVLIGQTTEHPFNHFGNVLTLVRIARVANTYHSEFPGNEVIGINDISLIWGGVFDIAFNWRSPHINHRQGKSVDIRGNPNNPNSIPRDPIVQERFMEICSENGAWLVLHESPGTNNEHFHCQWR